MRLAAIGLSLALALPSAAAADPPPTRLKLQSGFPLAMPMLGEMVAHFDETVRASGGGGVTIRLYDAGRLVPTLQIFDAVAAGKIDAGFSWPAYWMGKLPAATLFAAVPFGPGPEEFLGWMHHGGGLELWRELYAPHGAVPVPCGVIPAEASGWFARPIERAEDLRGLKIRFAGLGGKVLEKLGASITMLAAGDIFIALERGVIDATEYSMPAVDRVLGFHKVAPHYYFPGWHQPSSILELIVHRETWDGLPPERRRFLETACEANVAWSLARGAALQAEALAWFEAQGVTIHRWPPEVMTVLRATADEVMAEQAAANADFARAWRSLEAYRKRHAAWSALSETD